MGALETCTQDYYSNGVISESMFSKLKEKLTSIIFLFDFFLWMV